jgi:hypothetical protein
VAIAALVLFSLAQPDDVCAEEDVVVSESETVVEGTDTAAEAPAEALPAEVPTAEEAADVPTAEEPADDTAAPMPEEAVSEDEAPEEAPRWYRGMFEAEVDSVIADGGSDLDFSQYLRLDADPPKMPRLHLRGAVWLHQDLGSDAGKSSTLRDINDASSSDVQARLLYLYADIDDALGDQSVLRLGRQRIEEGAMYNRIDGIFVKKRVNKVEGYAFIGARASIYRDTSSDLVLGGGLSYLPSSQTRIALDGYYAEETRYGVTSRPDFSLFHGFSRPIAPEMNDSKVTLSFWHNFGPNTRLFGRVGMLGSELDELSLSLNGYVPRLDLLYDINYRQLFNTTGDTTGDLSPYYQILGQYREYTTLYVGLHRPLTKKVTLSLEGEVRDSENDDYYSGNRDYQRIGTVLDVEELYKGFGVTTSVEYWNVSEGEGSWTLTGEIYRNWKKVEWRVGVDFVRYKDRVIEYDRNAALLDAAIVALVPGIYPGFSWFTQNNSTRVVDTRENVYSIFTEVDWEFRDDQALFAKFSFEEDDGPDSPYWHTRAGYRINF